MYIQVYVSIHISVRAKIDKRGQQEEKIELFCTRRLKRHINLRYLS
jgi:hypothetical protein